MTWRIIDTLDTRIGLVRVIRHDHGRPGGPAYLLGTAGHVTHVGRATDDDGYAQMTALEWDRVWEVIHTDREQRLLAG